ncbi:MAG: FtsX-like permease family protein [Gemmatimonadales bacterium]|nr:FtsX-like permease family protein [Gemmatimonadales bacterium]
MPIPSPLTVSVVTPTIQFLRSRWRAAVAVIVLGALAVGLFSPIRSLTRGSGSLILPDIPSAGGALMWTKNSVPPSETQAASLVELLRLLSGLAWVGFGIASFSIFAIRGAEARERALETGVRRAVGASKRQIFLSLVVETLLLAAIALVVGLALGEALLSAGRHWWPGAVGAIRFAGPSAALALSAVLAAAGLASYSAVRPRHLVDTPDQEIGLKLPTYQVATSIALLMAAAALLAPRSGGRETPELSSREAGAVFRVDTGVLDPAERSARYGALLSMLARHPEVKLASLVSPGAHDALGTVNDLTSDCGRCSLGGIPLRWLNFTGVSEVVSPDTFRTRNMRLVSGRGFLLSDGPDGVRVAVINRHLAARYFERAGALGRDLYLGVDWPERPYKVIGIVEDERSEAIGGSLQPREAVYLSVLQHPPDQAELLIRGTSTAEFERTLLADVRRPLGPEGRVVPVGGEAEQGTRQLRAVRWFGLGFGAEAVAALAAALIGTVATTRRWADSIAWELALRRAVGARRWQMVFFVVVRVLGIGVGGVLIGLFLYGTVLVPMISRSLGRLPLANLTLLLLIATPPILVAVAAGALPGLRLLRRPPSTLLQ